MTRCADVVACTIFLLSFVLISVAAADSDVEGNVVGIWLLEDGPFHVWSDIEIPAGEELTIDSGARVLFEGNFHFTIRGRLNAVGGDQPDQHISFARPDSSGWWGLRFTPESHIRSMLNYCDIYYAWIGVECDSASPRLYNNYIKANNKGIDLDASSPDIDGNTLMVSGGHTQQNPMGICMINGSIPRVRNNRIELSAGPGSELIGVMINGSQPTIENNWIDLKSDGTAYGIYTMGHVTKLEICYNIIRTHSPTEMIGIRLGTSTGVRVYNNDVHLIGTSSACTGLYFDSGCNVILYNNIIFGNGSSTGIFTEDDVVSAESGYNDFWSNGVNYNGHWRGGNGDISANPRWVNAHLASTAREDYTLQWNNYPEPGGKSPCIDAGMPGPLDLDRTPQDMGAVYYHQAPVNLTPRIDAAIPGGFAVNPHPNPFNSQLNIDVNLDSKERVSIIIFDINGRAVQNLWSGELTGTHRLIWQPSNLPAGEYMLRLSDGNRIQTERIVFLP